jgi:hypothetical protein
MEDLALMLRAGGSIAHCRWRLRTFLERDAYADYDYASTQFAAAEDVITADHIYAMNSAMRARSSRAAWNQFIDRPLSELHAIPITLDLIDDADADIEAGLAVLGQLVAVISTQKRLTDMAASKVLFLKRPRFVGISDSYVRACLRIDDRSLGQPSETPAFYAARMLAVQRRLRELGQHNQDVLAELKAYADAIGTVVPAGGRFKGQRIAVRVSKVRILDILLWTETAINGAIPHQYWSHWYRTEVGVT